MQQFFPTTEYAWQVTTLESAQSRANETRSY